MDRQFWEDKWKMNEIGFHQQDTSPKLQQYWPLLQLPAGSTVFVPLCGKSLDILWLAAQGFNVVGVELSALAVQAFFAENSLSAECEPFGNLMRWKSGPITIYQGDVFELTDSMLQSVDAVFDRAALIALPEKMRQHYVSHLKRILPDNCKTLLITLHYDQQQMSGPPFSVTPQEVGALYNNWCSIDHLESTEVIEQEGKFKSRGLTSVKESLFILNS